LWERGSLALPALESPGAAQVYLDEPHVLGLETAAYREHCSELVGLVW
jgi:hypothetical protein